MVEAVRQLARDAESEVVLRQIERRSVPRHHPSEVVRHARGDRVHGCVHGHLGRVVLRVRHHLVVLAVLQPIAAGHDRRIDEIDLVEVGVVVSKDRRGVRGAGLAGWQSRGDARRFGGGNRGRRLGSSPAGDPSGGRSPWRRAAAVGRRGARRRGPHRSASAGSQQSGCAAHPDQQRPLRHTGSSRRRSGG